MTTQKRLHPEPTPTLMFSAPVFAFIMWARQSVECEVSLLGISREEDPLRITDAYLPPQKCSSATTAIDDEALHTFFEDCLEQGLTHEEFRRIWIHTHPGMDPSPSLTDWDTFKKIYGECPWGAMVIIGGVLHPDIATTLRGGPPLVSAHQAIPWSVDWRDYTSTQWLPEGGTWGEHLRRCVEKESPAWGGVLETYRRRGIQKHDLGNTLDDFDDPNDPDYDRELNQWLEQEFS